MEAAALLLLGDKKVTEWDYMPVMVEHVHWEYISTRSARKEQAMLIGLLCLLAQSQSPPHISPYETASWQTYQLLFL